MEQWKEAKRQIEYSTKPKLNNVNYVIINELTELKTRTTINGNQGTQFPIEYGIQVRVRDKSKVVQDISYLPAELLPDITLYNVEPVLAGTQYVGYIDVYNWYTEILFLFDEVSDNVFTVEITLGQRGDFDLQPFSWISYQIKTDLAKTERISTSYIGAQLYENKNKEIKEIYRAQIGENAVLEKVDIDNIYGNYWIELVSSGNSIEDYRNSIIGINSAILPVELYNTWLNFWTQEYIDIFFVNNFTDETGEKVIVTYKRKYNVREDIQGDDNIE